MATRCNRNGAPTIVPTVCLGFSDEYGSWNTIWMSLRSGRIWPIDRCETSRPSNRIVPAVGSSRRVSSRPVVVLPQPDSPTRDSVSPLRTAKSRPSTACTAPALRRNRPLRTGKYLRNPVTWSRSSVIVSSSLTGGA